MSPPPPTLLRPPPSYTWRFGPPVLQPYQQRSTPPPPPNLPINASIPKSQLVTTLANLSPVVREQFAQH